MADTAEVIKKLVLGNSKTKLLAIVANERGAEAAAAYEAITYLGFPFSVSETFQQRNTNKSIAEALDTVNDMQEICLRSGKCLVVYISMGFGNPYGDPYDTSLAGNFVDILSTLGIGIVSLADTIGVSTPAQITSLYTALAKAFPAIELGLLTGEKKVVTRVCDLQHAVSAVSGKVELVLEGEQEGAMNVARALLGRGVKALFSQCFPDAYKPKRVRRQPGAVAPPVEGDELASSEYRPVLEWFASGNHVSISDDMPQAEYAKQLSAVKGLERLTVKHLQPSSPEETAVAMELVLEGLHQNSILSRERAEGAITSYKDMLKSMLSGMGAED